MEKGSERGALRTTKEGSGIHTIWLFYRFYQVLFPHAWKYMLSTPFPFARTGMCSAQGHAVKLVAGETSTQGSWLHIQCLHAHSTHIPPLQTAGWSGSDEGCHSKEGNREARAEVPSCRISSVREDSHQWPEALYSEKKIPHWKQKFLRGSDLAGKGRKRKKLN